MKELIRFRDATLGYGRRPVLSGVDFDITEGEFLGVVGPNGSGKTTLIRTLLGTHDQLSGTVERADGLRFGYVPQREQVARHFPLNVQDVVLMGRYDRVGLARRPSRADRQLVHETLEAVGIADLARRPLNDLSGGQKQRTLIARALVGRPNVLVLDEPTNGMDLVSTSQILEMVRLLNTRDRLTVIMVSHALNEVINYVERIALVVNGRVRAGPVDEIITEGNLSDVYGISVEVDTLHGHRLVMARRPEPARE